jgi:hypothetical protein
MLKRVAPAIAGFVVVAALAVAVPTATGHPEECSTAAAWSSTDGGYSPYLSWQGAEESICASRSVTSRYDDSDAKLTREGQSATAGLRLIASRAKHGPFNTESAFNSDLAFENGYAYRATTRASRSTTSATRPTRRSPGRSGARARRTTSRSTTGS